MTSFVTMTDTFMSGWGKAEGKKNIYCVECDTTEQCQIIAENARKRSEMKHIKITDQKPNNTRARIVTHRHWNDLGEIWTAK